MLISSHLFQHSHEKAFAKNEPMACDWLSCQARGLMDVHLHEHVPYPLPSFQLLGKRGTLMKAQGKKKKKKTPDVHTVAADQAARWAEDVCSLRRDDWETGKLQYGANVLYSAVTSRGDAVHGYNVDWPGTCGGRFQFFLFLFWVLEYTVLDESCRFGVVYFYDAAVGGCTISLQKKRRKYHRIYVSCSYSCSTVASVNTVCWCCKCVVKIKLKFYCTAPTSNTPSRHRATAVEMCTVSHHLLVCPSVVYSMLCKV